MRVRLQNDDVYVVVGALQQHLAFKGYNLALLCSGDKARGVAKKGRELAPVSTARGAYKGRHVEERQSHLLAARRVPFSASKMFAQRSSSKRVPARTVERIGKGTLSQHWSGGG